MPAYRFEAASTAGRIERGVIDADSPRHARGLLRDRGMTPLDVLPVQDTGTTRVAIGGRMRPAEVSLCTRQLASLLAARLPLEQALGRSEEGRVGEGGRI